MSTESDSGFVVRDRRGGRSEEMEQPSAEAPPSTGPAVETEPAHSAAAALGEGLDNQVRPPVTFSSIVFSMGTSALLMMGESLEPNQAPAPVNLGQAKEIIDILSMLEAKTKGNLTGEEQSILTEMLYALRMKFVDLSGKSGVLSR